MSTTIDHIENFVTKAGQLAETKMELWKLKATGKISEAASSVLVTLVTAACLAVAFLMLSTGLAIGIGLSLGNLSYGFFMVGGFYVLAGFLVFLFRRQWIKKPLRNLMVEKMMHS